MKSKWFTNLYDENGNIKKTIEVSLKDLNTICYFCNFTEAPVHLHHIIRKQDGGDNSKKNLIPLCPNHHYMLHRGNWMLGYNPKEKFYMMSNKKTGKIIYPTEIQKKFKRMLPRGIKKNTKLIVKGDLKSKGTILIKKVCNEKGVQTN